MIPLMKRSSGFSKGHISNLRRSRGASILPCSFKQSMDIGMPERIHHPERLSEHVAAGQFSSANGILHNGPYSHFFAIGFAKPVPLAKVDSCRPPSIAAQYQ
jgi:hypothetical protein